MGGGSSIEHRVSTDSDSNGERIITGTGTGTGTETEAETGPVKLFAMEHTLSLGGHLLFWVFPLVLTVFVVADTIRDWRRGRL